MDTTDDLRRDFEERPVTQGTSVYDSNGDKVGEVSDRGLQQNALIVEKGFFFPRELYIPLSAIRGRAADGIHLNLTKDAIGSHNWDASAAAGADDSAVEVRDAGTENASLPINRNVAVPIPQEDLAAEKQREQMREMNAPSDIPTLDARSDAARHTDTP